MRCSGCTGSGTWRGVVVAGALLRLCVLLRLVHKVHVALQFDTYQNTLFTGRAAIAAGLVQTWHCKCLPRVACRLGEAADSWQHGLRDMNPHARGPTSSVTKIHVFIGHAHELAVNTAPAVSAVPPSVVRPYLSRSLTPHPRHRPARRSQRAGSPAHRTRGPCSGLPCPCQACAARPM